MSRNLAAGDVAAGDVAAGDVSAAGAATVVYAEAGLAVDAATVEDPVSGQALGTHPIYSCIFGGSYLPPPAHLSPVYLCHIF